MAYTNNTPQGNQQIATTQPLILGNFEFLDTGITQEHNFNPSGTGSDMYHLRASMPNQADPVSLPAGTNGQYYVNGGNAKYYDGTTAWRLNQFSDVLTGTFTISSASATNIATVPANVAGFGICYKLGIVQHFSFFSNGSQVFSVSSRVKLNGTSDDFPIEMNNASTGLTIQGTRFSATYNGTYTYKIWYRPA